MALPLMLLSNSSLRKHCDPQSSAPCNRRRLGLEAVNIPVGSTEAERAAAGPLVNEAAQAAAAAGEKVVVHCWGGGKRSGSALAAVLATRYSLSPELAAAELAEAAQAQGSSRAADVQHVRQLLSSRPQA
jgi:protein tyrosine phosphatase (PTP) superfamily phosphohydrolase (DUF442 family)